MYVFLFQCRQNQFGREMYKLCIFNFLATFCNAFLLNYPRKWVCLRSTDSFFLSHRCCLNGKINASGFTTVWPLYGNTEPHLYYVLSTHELSVQTTFPLSDRLVQEKYPSSLLARLLGKQHFLIPFNVLDLVYSQTVSWVGVYYCPLLPLIGTVTLMATFYIKKVVWKCYGPSITHVQLSLSLSLSLFVFGSSLTSCTGIKCRKMF